MEKTKALSQFLCQGCGKFGRRGAWVVPSNNGLCHVRCAPVSDPAPTVEASDAEESSMNDTDAAKLDDAFGTDYDISMSKMGPWFEAKYEGPCGDCGTLIEYGDMIRASGEGDYLCTDCGDEQGVSDTPDTDAWDRPDLPAPAGAFAPFSVNDDAAPGFVAGPPAPAEVSHWQQQARDAAKRHLEATAEEFTDPAPAPTTRANKGVPLYVTPDAFMDPAAPEETPAVNVSGQPDPRYEWWGEQNRGYLVKLPETGDFRRYKNGRPKGITRATTFNKAASDTTSLTDWKLRNVIVGASRRPDLLLRAHGLDVQQDSKVLNKLAAELEAVAGAKVGADIGTFLHEFCEHIDAGLKTWRDAPEVYQAQLKLYSETLAEAGFEPVPGMIERTTYIAEFGGVVGRFDRILFHRPSGMYVIADLKTGRTMDYARLENECQEWIYAHGVNEHGVYDWNTDTWCPPRSYGDSVETGPWQVPFLVSETVGLIIHMPVQGDDAGQVILERTDLQRGKRYAATCAENRGWVKPKRELWSWEPETAAEEVPQPPRERNWHAEFKAVTSREQANALYKELRATGANEEYLAVARLFGKQALTSLASGQQQR